MSIHNLPNAPQGILDEFARLLERNNTVRDGDGDPIEFVVKSRRHHSYYWFEGDDGVKYCWSIVKDTKGRWWSWEYRPIGSGQWKQENLKQHKQKQLAKSWARACCNVANPVA